MGSHQRPHPILSPLTLGPTTVIGSSAGLGWQGLLLEKHLCGAGERPDGNPLDRPVLIMQCSPTWRGEFKAANNAFVTRSETLGDLTVLPKGRLQAGRSRQTCDLLYGAFEEAYIASVRDELEGKRPPALGKRNGLADHAIADILNLLLGEVASGGGSTALYIDALTHALTLRYLFLGERRRGRSSGARGLTRKQLSRVQELIESRLDAELPLQELASTAGYSRSHFLRAFHATTGMTPHRYLLSRRIERARRLLAETNMSIAEIAYLCGFSSQAHLTIAFRKVSGHTPGRYRQLF
jgi:AraC family transcriptional regulator